MSHQGVLGWPWSTSRRQRDTGTGLGSVRTGGRQGFRRSVRCRSGRKRAVRRTRSRRRKKYAEHVQPRIMLQDSHLLLSRD